MKSISIKVYENNGLIEKVKVTKRDNGKVFSKITCKAGDTFVVKPLNKLKLKNRDRKVQILKFIGNYRNSGLRASVRFLDDTGGKGFLKVDELEKFE